MTSNDPESSALLKRLQRSLTLTEQAGANVRERRLSLPTSVSAAPIKPLPVIKLACFYECSCTEFGDNESHLSITTKKAELHESHGVAISYTWGEFDREGHVIGHWSGSSKEPVVIVLGSEWRVSSFKRRLVQLTAKYGACWIDQLCMPQTDEKIRTTLAEVPSIYKILPVVVLLPGSLCKCLRQALEEYSDAKLAVTQRKSPDTNSILDSKYTYLNDCLFGRFCLNSCGSCSWPSRLWPFQEFINSTTLSVLHINEETAPCSLSSDLEAQVDRLSDYLRVAYKKTINERGLAHFEAKTVLATVNLDFTTGLAFQHDALSAGGPLNTTGIARLLLGEPILTDKVHLQDGRFLLITLESLGRFHGRTATKEIDYILSTCTAWQDYSIPRDYSRLTARHLLEDVLYQLHQANGLFVPSRSPSGLLGGILNTASWDSSSSRQGIEIRDSTDVFGVLVWEHRLSAPDPTRIAMKLLPGSAGSLGMRAQSFGEWEHVQDIVKTIHRVLDIFSCWDIRFRIRGSSRRNQHPTSEILTHLLSPSPAIQAKGLALLMTRFFTIFDHPRVASYLDHLRATLLKLPTQLLEIALYDVLCDAIRVNSSHFREKQVKLIFSKWHGQRCDEAGDWIESSGTCLGFVNGPLFDRASSAGASFLTLAGRNHAGLPFYEVVRRPSPPDSTPEYAVIGIWLPLNRNSFKINEIGGVLVSYFDESNAVII